MATSVTSGNQQLATEKELNSFVVRKVRNAYSVDCLQTKQSFIVSKPNGKVICSCYRGKYQLHCQHKEAVLKEAKQLKKLGEEKLWKEYACRALGIYVYRLEQLVIDYNFDQYYSGKLDAMKLALKVIMEV